MSRSFEKINNDSVPFFEKEVKCPVCGYPSVHHYLKDHVFSVEKREEDFFISKYRWKKKEYNQFSIYSFFFWHCTKCKYTDEQTIFLKPDNLKTGDQHLIKHIYPHKASGDKVIDLLSKYVKYPYTDHFSVLSLHLLACYIQLLPEPYQRNVEKLARYFHRTSWIFRLEEAGGEAEEQKIFYDEYMKFYEQLQANFMNSLASLEDLQQWFSKRFELERKQKRNEWSTFRKKIEELYRNMTHYMDKIILLLQDYHRLGLNYKKQFCASGKNLSETQFYEYESYDAYLVEVKEFWPEMPINERTAILKAIQYYEEIIRSRILDNNKFKLFQVYKLIIYLYSRIDEVNKAIGTSDLLLEKASAFKNAALRRLQRLEIIKDDRIDPQMLKSYVKKVNDIIESVGYRKKKLLERKFELDSIKAKEIYTNNRNLPADKLLELFKKEQIMDEVIQKYMEEKQKETKKGFFQIFKL